VPILLGDLVDPTSTAVLAVELKRVTVGDLQASSPKGSPGNPLGAVAAATGLVPRLAGLFRAARSVGVRVVHCTAAFRGDGAGSATNAPLLARAYRDRRRLLLGSPEAEPALELGPAPEDLYSVRLSGVAPFVGTGLDAQLRNLGVRTVVVVGGSVNVGIVGATIEAVDLGYSVVIPRDGVIGHPMAYADAVVDNTLALLARVTTVAELETTWAQSAGNRPT
jgi:nicotinamidase-related amidase